MTTKEKPTKEEMNLMLTVSVTRAIASVCDLPNLNFAVRDELLIGLAKTLMLITNPLVTYGPPSEAKRYGETHDL